MAATQATALAARRNTLSPTLILIAGWLVPGLGHFLLKKYIRAALLFVSIVSMFTIGLALKGKVYSPTTGDPLDLLGFVGDVGAAGLYLLARVMDWGAPFLTSTLSDYGTKFIVVAGLLNVIVAVDAQSLANGRKAGL